MTAKRNAGLAPTRQRAGFGRWATLALALSVTPVTAMAQGVAPGAEQAQPQQPPVLPMPAVPEFKPLPAGVRPTAPVIGVFNTQMIMGQSVAVQKIEKELGTRRESLVSDVRAEETQLQGIRQGILKSGKAPTPAQQQELQKRVMDDRTKFGNRNRILEEDAQVGLNQVQREIQQIVSAIARARGMTMVLQAGTAALHDNTLDISNEVVTYLNTTLPSVYIPGPNEDPEEIAKSGKYPVAPFQMNDQGGEQQ